MTTHPDELPAQNRGELQPEDSHADVLASNAAVLRWFTSRVANREIAWDLTQANWEAYQVWRAKNPCTPVDSLTGFLLNLAEWTRKDYYKRAYKTLKREAQAGGPKDMVALEDMKLLLAADLPSSLASVVHSIDLGLALARLKERDEDKHRALMMRYIDQMNTKEIGNVLGVTPQRISQMVGDAIQLLKGSRHLANYGVSKGGHQ
ncbi:sigma-70 family RNA polymerase sigma factor [Lentzea flaviverrucosa]|uniref:RNA polymerase sigma factor, sigma-70 family n=1 Tax=Lentzea flaviverrucosa TaxID=200379 RepID=A0A1H9XKM6_9PSEU|nr:sigma-70 family RNA polymerase sigma factor [Lentzea flaviverrucosa]RDI20345.1 RNA polymerase sigma factor (sigma-70 family) [Lentzea flaviverrucosa]SES46682.1 RNA polymerase sigma factor, sigma-70 family [Lentzea flaviverrucosa]